MRILNYVDTKKECKLESTYNPSRHYVKYMVFYSCLVALDVCGVTYHLLSITCHFVKEVNYMGPQREGKGVSSLS